MLRECMENVRKTAPLVHCITNYVTAGDVANMLLACGARPIMADEPKEAAEITAAAAGLTLNLGTPGERTLDAMLLAGRRANELGHAVLFDPVGVGASRFRREAAEGLLGELHFDIVRGNVTEIRTLCGLTQEASGVDALAADAVTEEKLAEAVAFAKSAAGKLHGIVAVTGEIDLVTDGTRCYVIRGGRAEMSRVTGTGCQLSGLMTAYLAANPGNMLAAAAEASCVMKTAGEIAWEHLRAEEGNASYGRRIIDAVCRMDGDTIEGRARYEMQ